MPHASPPRRRAAAAGPAPFAGAWLAFRWSRGRIVAAALRPFCLAAPVRGRLERGEQEKRERKHEPREREHAGEHLAGHTEHGQRDGHVVGHARSASSIRVIILTAVAVERPRRRTLPPAGGRFAALSGASPSGPPGAAPCRRADR